MTGERRLSWFITRRVRREICQPRVCVKRINGKEVIVDSFFHVFLRQVPQNAPENLARRIFRDLVNKFQQTDFLVRGHLRGNKGH